MGISKRRNCPYGLNWGLAKLQDGITVKDMLILVKDGLYEVCVADVAGVSVEFMSREDLHKNPIMDMTD